MSETLNAISRSLSADVQRLAAISHNVANINTPGYRAVRAITEFGEYLQVRTVIEQGDGGLQQTERSLDLALRGDGFFVVERGGVPLLTRAGDFRIDSDGYLINGSGDRVLGQSGPIAMQTSDVRVDSQGLIWNDSRQLDRIYIVSAAEPGRLSPVGNGAYDYQGQLQAWHGAVKQGMLERSNVDPAEQTVRLMETTRHAESVQRAISIYDKALGTGINSLGDGQ